MGGDGPDGRAASAPGGPGGRSEPPQVVCPDCREPLAVGAGEPVTCGACGARYPARAGAGPDLRPRRALVRTVPQSVPPAGTDDPWEDAVVAALRPGPGPTLAHLRAEDFRHGNRLSDALVSRLDLRPGRRLLEVGCGEPNLLSGPLEALGVEHVGIDYAGDGPDYLADAHALPFADGAFDVVLTVAVLEHLRNPYLAGHEIARVLRPGGLVGGTVAFLEPHHLDSLFHHSAYGLWSVLHEAGFDRIEIEPNADWDVLEAVTEMGLLPGRAVTVGAWSGRVASLGTGYLWRSRGAERDLAHRAAFTGGFRFVAELPARP